MQAPRAADNLELHSPVCLRNARPRRRASRSRAGQSAGSDPDVETSRPHSAPRPRAAARPPVGCGSGAERRVVEPPLPHRLLGSRGQDFIRPAEPGFRHVSLGVLAREQSYIRNALCPQDVEKLNRLRFEGAGLRRSCDGKQKRPLARRVQTSTPRLCQRLSVRSGRLRSSDGDRVSYFESRRFWMPTTESTVGVPLGVAALLFWFCCDSAGAIDVPIPASTRW